MLPQPVIQAWWPGEEVISESQKAVAAAIAARVEAWEKAFMQRDLDGVLDLYSTDYQDPQGWRFQYVRRAYQWFFERYRGCRMRRQLRGWVFSPAENPDRVDVTLYCRFMGWALTDPTGRIADVPAWFPRHDTGEVRLSFVLTQGQWRLARTDPALPNMNEILGFSTGPLDAFPQGPDVYKR